MGNRKKTLSNIPNYMISLVMLLLFAVWVVFFNKNVGYAAFERQLGRIDTLNMQCDELRRQITSDSVILDALHDSTKLDRYLHEKMLFVGKGETMFQVIDTSSKAEKR